MERCVCIPTPKSTKKNQRKLLVRVVLGRKIKETLKANSSEVKPKTQSTDNVRHDFLSEGPPHLGDLFKK